MVRKLTLQRIRSIIAKTTGKASRVQTADERSLSICP